MRAARVFPFLFLAGLAVPTPGQKWTPPNFIRELRYTCYPDKKADLIAYFARLADADIKENSGRMRWMDGEPYGQLVIAGIPAYHLAEYDTRVGSGTVFTRAFGAEEYRRYAQGYSNAQQRTHSVIRKYRDDLSLNRDKHLRAATRVSRYTYVTVKPGKAAEFEEAARKTVAALRAVAPATVMSVGQTIAGGGPQYLFVRPFGSYAEMEKAVDAAVAVEKAFGKAEAARWAALRASSVESTETALMEKVAKDSFMDTPRPASTPAPAANGPAAPAGSAAPNYVQELWYEVYTNKSGSFNAYLARIKEADVKVASGRKRWVDVHPWSNLRIVSVPVVEMAEYDRRPPSAEVVRQAFGEEDYRKHSAGLLESAISRTSYLRKYRDDLSLNRARHTRDGIKATAYSFVTTLPFKEPAFEQLWGKALAAYRKVAPDIVLSVAQTVAGGGPQYLIARPLASYAEFESCLTPEEAIEKSFGRAELERFNRAVSESVKKWETLLFDRSSFDTNAR